MSVEIYLADVPQGLCTSVGCEDVAFSVLKYPIKNGVQTHFFCLTHILFAFEKLVGSWPEAKVGK